MRHKVHDRKGDRRHKPALLAFAALAAALAFALPARADIPPPQPARPSPTLAALRQAGHACARIVSESVTRLPDMMLERLVQCENGQRYRLREREGVLQPPPRGAELTSPPRRVPNQILSIEVVSESEGRSR